MPQCYATLRVTFCHPLHVIDRIFLCALDRTPDPNFPTARLKTKTKRPKTTLRNPCPKPHHAPTDSLLSPPRIPPYLPLRPHRPLPPNSPPSKHQHHPTPPPQPHLLPPPNLLPPHHPPHAPPQRQQMRRPIPPRAPRPQHLDLVRDPRLRIGLLPAARRHRAADVRVRGCDLWRY